MKRLLAYMATQKVAANLLMLFFIVAGLVSAMQITQKVFPEFSLDKIQVHMQYPGAAPAEVESSIIQRIEEALQDIDDIQTVSATAAQSNANVLIELRRGADVSQKLDEVKSAIDRITTFPVDAEQATVSQLSNRKRALQIALYGQVSEHALKELAYLLKHQLSAKPGISFVQVSAARDYEVSISVAQNTLRAYQLSLPELAEIIRHASLDLPGGEIKTADNRVLIRVNGQKYLQQDFADIVVRARANGGKVRLGDIAQIEDGFADTDLRSRYNGQNAIFVDVYRIGDEKILKIVDSVNHYLQHELALPEGVHARLWRNSALELKSRMDLLLKNALQGLLLVVILLALFLDVRLAFWVSLGIFVAFIGAFFVMDRVGIDIHQISLFAFIMAIGIVVDDAIVVAENIYVQRQQGLAPLAAAISGVQQVAVPVLFAVLTTIIAFMSLLFIPGSLGKFLFAIPAVVIIILSLSLLEALFILPHHLSHLSADFVANARVLSALLRLQQWLNQRLQFFVNHALRRAVNYVIGAPWSVIVGCASLFVLSISLVAFGYIKLSFFPKVEGQYVSAQIELPPGSSRAATQQVADFVFNQGKLAAQRLAKQYQLESSEVYHNVHLRLGQVEGSKQQPVAAAAGQHVSANLASIEFELVKAQHRPFSAKAFEDAWRQATGPLPGVKSLTFTSALINVGEPIQVELSANTARDLKQAVSQLKQALAKFAGVNEIHDDQSQGQLELQLALLPAASDQGLSLNDVARQVRAGFYGAEAQRMQRGQHEVRVYVRLPKAERDSLADLENFRVRNVDGAFIPLTQVVRIHRQRSPATILRRNAKRIITVTAHVDKHITTGEAVNQQLRQVTLPALARAIPGLSYDFAGEQRRKAEVAPAMLRNFALALLMIYALMAIVFNSYRQPLFVLAAIPMGIVGALLGHLLMGLSVGLLTVFGLIGLSGVIINNAIVLIDRYNSLLQHNKDKACAIVLAVQSRFRPILLTSLTTFLGVTPLLLERSLQAQFLIPMAASIGFGVLFGSGLVILLIPALLSLLDKRLELD